MDLKNIINFKNLKIFSNLKVNKDNLKAEMLVAKNCILNSKNNFELDTIKQILKKDTFPNI
ncbi:Dimer Tnp hAT domain-containing protein, partial [Aphis craccivora]